MKFYRPEDKPDTAGAVQSAGLLYTGLSFDGEPDLPDAAYRSFQLVCGHWTNRDVQVGYQIWRPAKGLYYCEHYNSVCGWVRAKPKPKREELPQEPLF